MEPARVSLLQESAASEKVSELTKYQKDNFELLVVFDNRKVVYMVVYGLICFGVGICAGLAFAYQASHV